MNALINPSADVQSFVAAVIAACGQWQPTDVPVPVHPAPPTVAIAPGLTEAQVCNFIQHPGAQFWTGLNAVLFLVLMVVAIGWAFRLHRLPGAVWRLAKHLGWRVSA